MASVTVFSAARMEEIEKKAITNATVNTAGDLTFITRDGTQVPAGNIKGPTGPAGVAPDATQTVKGIAELATNAEAVAGTDAVRIVTPAGLTAALITGYRLVDTVVFTASGTFTKANYPGARAIRVKCVGGGGGGGGTPPAEFQKHAAGGGGGGGGYAEAFVLLSALGATTAVTIGSGGTGVVQGVGNSGGATSFGTHAVAGGGSPGQVMSASTDLAIGAIGGMPGMGIAGQILGAGTPGGMGGGLATLGQSGSGGSSMYGGGYPGIYSGSGAYSNNGGNAMGYGGGGGGAVANQQATVARAGGSGSAGIVIVEVFR